MSHCEQNSSFRVKEELLYFKYSQITVHQDFSGAEEIFKKQKLREIGFHAPVE